MIKDTILDTTYQESGGSGCGLVTKGIYWRKTQNGADSPLDHSNENNYTCAITSYIDGIINSGELAINAQGQYYWKWCKVNTGWPGFIDKWNANDDLALLNKLQEKFNGHDFSSGTSAAELGEAVDMIYDRGRQILAAARAAKRGRLDIAARILAASGSSGGSLDSRKAKAAGIAERRKKRGKKHTSNKLKDRSLEGQAFDSAWLELQWGWKPLLKDVYELSKLIQALSKPRKNRIIVREKKGGSIYSPNPSMYSVSGSLLTKKQIIAYIDEVNFPTMHFLGLDDPMSVIWELIPLSCIVDYFLPVGNYLAARNFSSSVSGRFVTTKTTKRQGKLFLNPSYVNTSYPKSQDVTASYLGVTVDRVVSSTLAVPMPEFKFRDFINSPFKVLNVAALLGAIFT